MPYRSSKFIRDTLKAEGRRPILWLMAWTVLIQIYSDEGATLFGADQDKTLDLTALGFSPEHPLRLGGLPWLASGLVHVSPAHLAQNLSFLLIVYLALRNKISAPLWWWLLPTLQMVTNLTLFICTKIFTESDGMPHLYLGLSGVALALLGFGCTRKVKALYGAALFVLAYEVFQLVGSSGGELAPYSHLLSFATGLVFGQIAKSRISSPSV